MSSLTEEDEKAKKEIEETLQAAREAAKQLKYEEAAELYTVVLPKL